MLEKKKLGVRRKSTTSFDGVLFCNAFGRGRKRGNSQSGKKDLKLYL